MKGIKLLWLSLICYSALHSQPDTASLGTLSSRMLKKMGANALKQGDPGSSASFYKAALKKNKRDPDALTGLGIAYMRQRDYKRAQRAFLSAYEAGNKGKATKPKYVEALYFHALMQKSNNLYDSARVNFTAFKKQYKGGNKVMKRQAAREIAFCDSLARLSNVVKKVSVFRLDTSVNKVNTEAAPLLIDDYTLVFTSLRTEKQEIISEEDTGRIINRKLYFATKKNGKWKYSGEYGDVLNEKGANTGNACLSPDKKKLYFTKCKPAYNGEMICAIYVSVKNGEVWGEPVKLPKSVNQPKYTSSMPAVNTDAKGNEVIYFVSNRKKSKGGTDIWYTVYNKKTNTYREPKNAGTKVNTTQNELSPFFDKETQSLYFSSDGMGGFGGFDVFRAIGDGKRWMAVENIGKPVNTGADELYYTISENRREGFFVSNRAGGNTLKNATCCDDIYSYFDNEYREVILTGNISDQTDPFAGLNGVLVEVYLKTPGTDEKVLVKTSVTNSKGDYTVSLQPGQDYFIKAKKPEYLGSSLDVNTNISDGNLKVKKDIELRKKPAGLISLPDLRYEFSSSKLTKESESIIDTTVFIIMQMNPEIIIEVHSHTDNKGNDNFNLKLSQKRAESVVVYLVKKGINPKRLRAKGFGETVPIAPNENADGSDNPEGRSKNRRTNFKIVGELEEGVEEKEK